MSEDRRPMMRRSPTPERYTKEFLAELPTFELIHLITADIRALCDTPLSNKQLESPKLIYLTSPLTEKYKELETSAIIYCLLVCRIHFLDYQTSPGVWSIAHSRAALCEIIAIKVLRKIYDEDPDGEETLLHLAHMLADSFSPFQGAPRGVLKYHRKVAAVDDPMQLPKANALELAIVARAKRLIRSPPCQKIIEAIWRGEIIYKPTSFIDLLPDNYQRKPITVYNHRYTPLLDQQRLIVPRIRAAIEFAQFLVLFASYLAVVLTMEKDRMNGWEIWLAIYASGFALDKFATLLEHGYGVYVQNIWNAIDIGFMAVYFTYLVLRIADVRDASSSLYSESLNVLACGSIILFPRFAFMVVSNTLLTLGLRAMFLRFMHVIATAACCLGGFLVAFWLLGQGQYSLGEIAKFMIWTMFGLEGSAITRASDLHWLLGPILFVAYALLSSTLLITTTTSILTHTYYRIAEDSDAEILFRQAVSCLEGIKSDAIFLYQPPFNIPVFIIMFPLQFFLSSKTIHTVHVTASQILNAPLLLLIAAWERRDEVFRTIRLGGTASLFTSLFQRFQDYLSVHQDLKTVFEVPEEYLDFRNNGSSYYRSDFDEEEADAEESRRGRSDSPVTRGRNREATALRHRSRTPPRPLTRMYGQTSAAGELDDVVRRLDGLEEVLLKIEEALRTNASEA